MSARDETVRGTPVPDEAAPDAGSSHDAAPTASPRDAAPAVSSRDSAPAASSRDSAPAASSRDGAAAGSSRGAAPADPPRATAEPGPVASAPRVDTAPPSPDVDLGVAAPAIPGEHRGGFQRLPTAPLNLPEVDLGPSEEPEPLREVVWAEPEPQPRHVLSGWALAAAVVALAASFFVGWGFPVGIVGVVLSIIALRRPLDSRAVAGWALALSLLSLVYSAGWLLWTASQLSTFE